MLRMLDFTGGWRLGLALALVSRFPAIGAAAIAKDDWIKSLVAQLNAQGRYPPQTSTKAGRPTSCFASTVRDI